jgi:hypothetical protein
MGARHRRHATARGQRDAQSVRLLQGWPSASALSSGTVSGSLGGRGPGLGHTLQELSGELSYRMTTKQIFATRTSRRVQKKNFSTPPPVTWGPA